MHRFTVGVVAVVVASTVWMALWYGWRGSSMVIVPGVVLHAFWRISTIKNLAT